MPNNDHVFYRSQSKVLPIIEKGEGIYLFDTNGKRYVDASSGALISNIGHSLPEIAKTMADQATKIEFVHGTMFGSLPSIKLAKRIVDLCPKSFDKVYFVSGGSEAIETAIKMARSYHLARGNQKKYLIISRWQSYHGASIGALSLSGRTMSRKIYQPYMLDFPHISPAYCYRCPYEKTIKDCGYLCAKELDRMIKQVGAEHVSAFIAEPIVGATLTTAPAPPKYFSIIKDICAKHDVLFIADEVMTGFGRTGKHFGVDHYKVIPDIIVGGKGLGAGYYPVGMVACTKEVYREFKEKLGSFNHGYTYQGNPLAAAVSLAVLDFIHENNLVEYVKKTSEYLFDRLSILYRHKCVGDIRGKGFMAGMEFVQNRKTKKPFPVNMRITQQIADAAWEKGLIIYPSTSNGQVDGVAGDGIMVAPPLITTKTQIDDIILLLDSAIAEVQKKLSG